MFTDDEIAYLRSQRLGRLATVAPDGQPDVSPVVFELDGNMFYVGGRDPVRTRKFRNVEAGNRKVSLVVDDLASTAPWAPRFVRVYGTAEIVRRPGQFGDAWYLRITPTLSWSFNLSAGAYGPDNNTDTARRTVHVP